MTERRYAIHSIFGPTLQGEGYWVGTPTMFVRLGGCNMWDGRPETRAGSQCPFCDTDFRGNERYTAQEIIDELDRLQIMYKVNHVVLTGGEPMLQVDWPLIEKLTLHNTYYVEIETNGTKEIDINISDSCWITCSPKVPFLQLAINRAHALKLLYPHPNPLITPESFQDFDSQNKYLQPIDECFFGGSSAGYPKEGLSGEPYGNGFGSTINEAKTVEMLFGKYSDWRLSLQTHKYLGLD